MKIIFYLFISMSMLTKDVILLLYGIGGNDKTYNMSEIKKTFSNLEVIDGVDVDTSNTTIKKQAEKVFDFLKTNGITAEDRIKYF